MCRYRNCSCTQCVPWTVRENWGWAFAETLRMVQYLFLLVTFAALATNGLKWWVVAGFVALMLPYAYLRHVLADDLYAARMSRVPKLVSEAPAPCSP